MAYRWPAGLVFNRITLDVEDRSCPVCGRSMHVCDHRYHHLWTFQGATQVINRLVRCPDPSCESRGRTFSPEAELSISMPRWCLGWDVFCWLGHRRFARHWSVPQLRLELHDTHRIRLSDDAIETYIGRYQTMLTARQHDPEQLAEAYRDIGSLVLTIDGLQPEKGHETLYVVRELMCKRVWFAEPLLSSATQEVRRLIILARQWAEHVGKPVRAWMSDKQDAFVTAIADEFVGVPHRYCHNHFLRDVAQPVLDMDSQAKVKMRSKVRGLRAIERRVLADRRQAATPDPPLPQESPQGDGTPCIDPSEAATAAPCAPGALSLARLVFNWCVARRGQAEGPRRTGRSRSRGPSAWPRLATHQLKTRRAKWCSGIAQRCGVFSMTAKAVRCAHPVYGCVRPYKTYATRWIVICKPKKGSCRVAIEPSCWLY